MNDRSRLPSHRLCGVAGRSSRSLSPQAMWNSGTMACATVRIVKLGRREARLGGGVEAAGRAARDDLHHAGSEADEDADLPGAVVGTGEVEDQPAAERRPDLVHYKRDAEQRRHVAGAEHLGDEAAD